MENYHRYMLMRIFPGAIRHCEPTGCATSDAKTVEMLLFVGPRAQLQLDSLQGPIKQLTSLVSKEILVFVEVFNKPKEQHKEKKKKAVGGGGGNFVEGRQASSQCSCTVYSHGYPETATADRHVCSFAEHTFIICCN